MLTVANTSRILEGLLAEGKLSIFAGSGVSVDSGLPKWDGFIDKYISICEMLNQSIPDDLKFTKIIEDAKIHKGKDLIGRISVMTS